MIPAIPARRTFSLPFAILADRLPVFGRTVHFRCRIRLGLRPAGVFVDAISPPASPGRGLSAPGARSASAAPAGRLRDPDAALGRELAQSDGATRLLKAAERIGEAEFRADQAAELGSDLKASRLENLPEPLGAAGRPESSRNAVLIRHGRINTGTNQTCSVAIELIGRARQLGKVVTAGRSGHLAQAKIEAFGKNHVQQAKPVLAWCARAQMREGVGKPRGLPTSSSRSVIRISGRRR